MKKIVFFFLMGIVCPSLKSAAQHKDEISVSYGAVAAIEITTDFLSGSEIGNSLSDRTGNIFISYRRKLNKMLFLGCTFGYKSYAYESWYNNGPNPSDYRGNENMFSFCLELKIRYRTSKHFEYYGLVGSGVTIVQVTTMTDNYGKSVSYQNPNDYIFSSQYSPFCFSLGGRLKWFVEFGVGYKGLINTGFSYKF